MYIYIYNIYSSICTIYNVHLYIYIYRERQLYFKELACSIRRVGESKTTGQASSWEAQAGVSIAVLKQNFFPSEKLQGFP